MSLPISVVIPTVDSRYEFLVGRCLPSVRMNCPSEIVVVSGEDLNGNEKRNAGALAARQPYIIFVDDDKVLKSDCLATMHDALQDDDASGFAYSDFTIVPHQGVETPFVGLQSCGDFNLKVLRQRNYIDTCSLIRRSVFPGFDPKIRRFQDWDLWLTIVAKNWRGRYIQRDLFESHKIDRGVSDTYAAFESMEAVRRKHNLT